MSNWILCTYLIGIAASWPALGAPLAAAHPIRFENLTNADGLSQVSALAITQDRKGFVWIGTEDGLNRYDGYRFRVLRHRPGDPGSSLLGGAVQALHTDRGGHLWIGMRSGGFSRFDPATEHFTHFLQGAEDLGNLSQYMISSIHEDRTGVLWIGFRGGGLLRLDPLTEELTRYRHDASDPGSLGHDVVEALDDTPGSLWIGTDGGGLDRLDLATRIFTHYRQDPGDPASAASDRVRALHAEAGTVWIGTDGGGLLRFDPASERFTPVPSQGSAREQFIWVLRGDRSGVLWIGTRRGGLMRLDPSEGRFTRYRHDPNDPGGLSSNEIRSIFEDDAGNLWIGTWTHGVDRFHPDDEPFFNYEHDPGDPRSLSEGIVMALHEDRSGVLWVGTTSGLNRLDSARRGFSRNLPGSDDPDRLKDDVVLALHEDRAGNLWVGVPGALYRLDPSRRHVTPYPFDPEASGSQEGSASMALLEGRSGELWIGSYRGLTRLDPATGAFVNHRHDPDDPSSLGHDYVTALAEDRSGILWIGTLGGLNWRDPSGRGFQHFPPDPGDLPNSANDQILSFREDRSGILWIGTFGGGLVRFEPESRSFTTAFTEADGLPSNVVWAIVEDGLGRLWMSTTRGLARFDPETERFTTYDPADGILDYEFNLGAGLLGADGWMYFGNVRGVDAFRPERFRDNSRPAPVVLTSFRIFQEEADLDVAPSYLEEIELSHRQNFFSFEFAALNFRRPDKNRYAYMLDAFDKDWIDGRTLPAASYTNVSPGDYVFRVRASNNDGVWNDEGIGLAIVVHPPLWATWWAYSLYGLAAVAVGGGYVRTQRNKIAREQAMVKRLREVDRLKDEFLANTSHELRTPLFGITGLAESLIDGTRGELPAAAKADLEMVVSSGRRLTSLVNDILDFSKLRHQSLELKRRPVDLQSLTDVVLTLSRPLASDKELVLVNAVAAGLPPADADEDRLQQILHNLVGNAVKFTEEGSVEVTASVEGEELVVCVADTGIGIAEADRDRVFHFFEQADASTHRLHGGTGLGLAVSRQLVELHGGEIWLESKPGQGSTFCLSLPVADGRTGSTPILDAASEEPAPVTAQVRAEADGGDPRTGERLLIVDDEPVNRQVLINHLRLDDYHLQTAASGPEALRLLEEKSFDLVLLDLMMPKMSGYEVCRKIRQHHSAQELPVIIMTARSRATDVVSGFAAGANDYLTKPISKSELTARVRSHLDLLRLHRDLESLVVKRTHELEQRQQLIAELERLVAEVDCINYTVSHDLKNPLVTIKNYLGMVMRSAAEGDLENLNQGLERIDSAADQMHWLLDELIRYSRVGHEVRKPEQVAVAELVEVARERLAVELEERGFEIIVAADLPRVQGDPALLLIAFESLLENAVKFIGEAETPRIEIGTRRDRGREVIYVRDNGIGIEPQYHEKIFMLFDRLAAKTPGLGVGLALVRRIVEAHGGRVWVESDGVGTGSSFCFTLPPTAR